MGRELTRRHSLLFEKKGLRNLATLFSDLSRYQKWSELVSFAIWEVYHRLGLFPNNRYLKFEPGEALALSNEELDGPDFTYKLGHFFESLNWMAERSAQNWKLLFNKADGEIFGCLYPDDRELYRSPDRGESVVFIHRFPERIKSIFISSQNMVFVCVKGAVYRSADNGASFKKVLELGSPESFFRHNNAMTETPDHTLLIGEYGNVWEGRGWRKLAYIYSSSDGGSTWARSDFLIKRGTNKHVHLVKYSGLLNRVLLADGDNKKKLWLSEPLNAPATISDPQWRAVNKVHVQMGGYTSVVESDGLILFGTDYQGGTNFIVETADGHKFTKRVIPDPYRRSPIDNMVLRRSGNGTEIWANLPYSTANTRCLLMVSKNGGKSWHKVIEYSRAVHKVWLLSSAADPSEILFISVENEKDRTRVVLRVADRQV